LPGLFGIAALVHLNEGYGHNSPAAIRFNSESKNAVNGMKAAIQFKAELKVVNLAVALRLVVVWRLFRVSPIEAARHCPKRETEA